MSESKPEILALIPARGGSKAIPRKNLVQLAGRPLLAHSIEQAQATPAITRVVVSTDDDEIADCARNWGADVVCRPADLATDTADSESALRHALDHLREAEGYEPDLVVFLQATSPLRRPDDMARAVAQLQREGTDSLFSASPAHGFVWRQNGDDLRALSYDPAHRPRRQDIGEDWMENGSIYVFKPWVLRELNNRLGGSISVFPMDPLDSFQIDEWRDLELFERLLKLAPTMSHASELSAVRLLVLDFDGVLTDNSVWVDQNGVESVRCSRGDGLGLERLRSQTPVEVVVLSKERNPVVQARCRKLGVECFQGYDEKLPQLEAMAAERGLGSAAVAYVGNDVNDLEAMEWSGLGIAVSDAEPEVLAAADFVTERRGGRGAVREVCDRVLAARRSTAE